MKSEHITKTLDETGFANLSSAQIAEIKHHAQDCPSCHTAFQSAQMASSLLTDRQVEIFEPTPFFETKVLAALREKQIVAKPIAAFWRWWHASSAVVLPILLVVITLITLTFFAPQQQQVQAVTADDLSTDAVILQGNNIRQELTTQQALQIIYDQRDSK